MVQDCNREHILNINSLIYVNLKNYLGLTQLLTLEITVNTYNVDVTSIRDSCREENCTSEKNLCIKFQKSSVGVKPCPLKSCLTLLDERSARTVLTTSSRCILDRGGVASGPLFLLHYVTSIVRITINYTLKMSPLYLGFNGETPILTLMVNYRNTHSNTTIAKSKKRIHNLAMQTCKTYNEIFQSVL